MVFNTLQMKSLKPYLMLIKMKTCCSRSCFMYMYVVLLNSINVIAYGMFHVKYIILGKKN